MSLFSSGSQIANVELTDTFNTWRTRFNDAVLDGVSESDTRRKAIKGGIDVGDGVANTSSFAGITIFTANVQHSAFFDNTSQINARRLAATGLVTAPTVTANSATIKNITADGTVTTAQVSANVASLGNSAIFTAFESGSGSHPTHQQGRFFYDGVHDAFNFQTDISGFNGEVGMNEYIRVYNNTGGTLSKGEAAYLSGVHTDNVTPLADKADASDAAKYNTSGLISENINNGNFGYITVSGEIRDLNTTGLTAGQRVFVSPSTPGGLVTTAPTFPNYPMCIGYVVRSDATNGHIVIEQQNHSVPSFRVINNAYIGNDLTIAGDLTVQGTETTISTTGLEVSNTFIYVGAGDDIANAEFSGTGINDLTFKGYYEGTGQKTYYVRIDGTGTPDTFEWSIDNFSTTEATDVAITGANQTLANGISVLFNATTGHTLNDSWNGTVTHSEVDLGFAGHYNDGSGYTHTGIFRDATDDTWKFFNQYRPEVSGTINVGDATFGYADVAVKGLAATGPVTAPNIVANTVVINDNIKFNNFMREEVTVVADNPASYQNFNVTDATIQYFTTNTDTNFTLNIRGSASQALNDTMSTGESLSLTMISTNGATPYYLANTHIDGTAIAPNWTNGISPSGGNANGLDAYSMSVIKTGSNTFTILASQTKFGG